MSNMRKSCYFYSYPVRNFSQIQGHRFGTGLRYPPGGSVNFNDFLDLSKSPILKGLGGFVKGSTKGFGAATLKGAAKGALAGGGLTALLTGKMGLRTFTGATIGAFLGGAGAATKQVVGGGLKGLIRAARGKDIDDEDTSASSQVSSKSSNSDSASSGGGGESGVAQLVKSIAGEDSKVGKVMDLISKWKSDSKSESKPSDSGKTESSASDTKSEAKRPEPEKDYSKEIIDTGAKSQDSKEDIQRELEKKSPEKPVEPQKSTDTEQINKNIDNIQKNIEESNKKSGSSGVPPVKLPETSEPKKPKLVMVNNDGSDSKTGFNKSLNASRKVSIYKYFLVY